MKRSKPLKRHDWMRRRKRRKKPGDDPWYLEAVRGLPCVVQRIHVNWPCEGRVHAHHAGRRPGVGLKAPDETAIPLCAIHHAQWHGAYGLFALMTSAERRSWADDRIEETQLRLMSAAGVGWVWNQNLL